MDVPRHLAALRVVLVRKIELDQQVNVAKSVSVRNWGVSSLNQDTGPFVTKAAIDMLPGGLKKIRVLGLR